MTHTVTGPTPIGRDKDGSALRILWETLGQNEAGGAVEVPEYADMTIQVVGTFSGGTVTIQGSNDGATWATLSDPQGNALTFTSTRIEALLENPRYIRPSNSDTASMDIDIYLIARRTSSLRT